MSDLFNEMMEESSEKDNKIADLKAKLSESEEDLKATTESLYASREYLDQLKSEKWALEKQLAEKNNEIESLKDNWNILCDYLGECVVKYDEEDINGIYGEVLDKVNELKKYDYKRHQDKISFCIEELEKIKNLTDGRTYLAQYISQRIEELKAKNSMPLGENDNG